MRRFLVLSFLLWTSPSRAFQDADLPRWEKQARNITIVRDDWGIAHVSGKTDVDAVFGMIYAQAEDDFNRVETNYLNSMGRLAEAEGEAKIYQDLRMKLFIQPEALKNLYGESPQWLQVLMEAWADGLNFYLAKHPDVHPRVIRHFEPWMALSFTEGSIGGDIERVDLKHLEAFYGKKPLALASVEVLDKEPSGSNGAAIGPANTAGHHALLLINPHTSFFFRSELQMTSSEGLNAYGAATWGQFFIYQGFNEHAGWMHTSSGVDAVDEYLETVTKKDGKHFYRYGTEQRPVTVREIAIPYKSANGMAEKKFTAFFTHHGPVIREQDGKWVSIRLMNEPVRALMQSYTRTKAINYKTFRETMELKANSSNNTIFADSEGNIAYFHGDFIPRRDTRFDFTKPVDGADPATDWQGLHAVSEIPQLLNPSSGWLYNTNDWPWAAAGPSSPKKTDFPAYVETGGESARGVHAVRVLESKKDFTLDSLLDAAYDGALPWFEKSVPLLMKAWDAAPAGELKERLRGPVGVLRQWNMRWAADSVATSLAVFWGEDLIRRVGQKGTRVLRFETIEDRATSDAMLASLDAAVKKLNADFGTWKTAWGEINRFQRLSGDIVHPFSDAGASIPVAFTSAQWGSLASFGARAYPQTKKWYGTSGNSFVAVVEFGEKVRARAVSAGGESGHAGTKHFNDQAVRYSTGDLREVYFYPSQLEGHTERRYHPGE